MMAAAAGVIVMGLVGLNANLPAGGCCDQVMFLATQCA